MQRKHGLVEQRIDFPEACQERRLQLSDPRLHVLREQGIYACGLSELVSGYRVQRSHPDFNLIIWTFAGQASFTCGNRTLQILPGTVLAVPPGIPHLYQAGKSWNMFWVHIAKGRNWSFLGEPGFCQREAVYSLQLLHGMNQLLHEELSNSVEAGLLLHLYSQMMLVYLRRELRDAGSRKAQLSARFNELWERVHSSPEQNWTLARMAQKLYLSPAQFSRQCQKIYQQTPVKMVTGIRMRRAGEILHNSALSLQQIAEKTGYANAFSFSAAFKKQFGVSPKYFRE